MGKPTRILIVQSEDRVSISVAEMLHREYRKRGEACSTEYTRSGIEAFERLLKGDVDLLITGMQTLEIRGEELIRKVRDSGIRVAIAVLSLEVSAWTRGISRMPEGCDCAFEKPPPDFRAFGATLFDMAKQKNLPDP